MADQALIDRIAKDPDLDDATRMHLLSQIDPDFPKETTVRQPRTSIATERQQPSPATVAAQKESFPRMAARGTFRGLEQLVSPGLGLSQYLLTRMGILSPNEPSEADAVIGSISDQFGEPVTGAGRVVSRAAEEIGAGGPFLGQARKAGILRKTIADLGAMGTGAGLANEMTPSFVGNIPGGKLASEVLGQLGGLGLRRTGQVGIKAAVGAIPSIRENRAHSAFLERMGQQIGGVDEAIRKIHEAESLKSQFPGFQPTLAQATGDPGLLAIEEQARRVSPQLETKMRKRGEESRTALREGLAGAEEQMPATPERVTAAVQRVQRDFEGRSQDLLRSADESLRSIEARYAEKVNALDPATREEAGTQIFKEVEAAKQNWQKETNVLYNTGPAKSAKNKKVLIEPLKKDLRDLENSVDSAETGESFPKKLVEHIKSVGTDEQGNLKTVTFENLRTLRRVAGRAEEAAAAEAAPDRLLLKRIRDVQSAIENQIDLSLSSSIFSIEEVAALEKANAAYRAGIEKFGQDPVVKLFRGGIHGEESRIPATGISEMFLHGGKGGVEDARALVAAVGPDKANILMRQSAMAQVQNLRDSSGTLSPARYETWLRQHRDVLREFPTLQRELGSLAAAQKSLKTSQAAVAALPKAIKTPDVLETDAASLYLEQPTRLAIKSTLDSPKAPELLNQTLRLTEHDPVARMGLRRGVWNELTSRMGLTVPEGTLWTDHTATVAEIIAKNKSVMESLYTPRQLKMIEDVAKGEQILNRMPKEQRVQLESIFQGSGMGKFMPAFASRMFAVASGRTSEQFVMAEAASRRVVAALEGLDENKQRLILEHTLMNPDLLGTFNQLVREAGSVPQAKVKFRQFLITLGLESRGSQGEQKKP